MSNCDRLTDDAAFVDCLMIAPFDAWTARDAMRLLTIAIRTTHTSTPQPEEGRGVCRQCGYTIVFGQSEPQPERE